jgi:hypothetical protein
MPRAVVIKEVDGVEICLQEISIHEFPTIPFIGVLGISIVCGWYAFTTTQEPVNIIMAFITFAIVALALLAVVLAFSKENAGYEIYICEFELGSGIHVIKTTGDADRVAISNAVQELEPQAKEIAKNRLTIERIAHDIGDKK